jgi:enolase
MGKTSIKSVKARQILDAKGKPMVEVDVVTEAGVLGRGSAPSGVSAGEHEAYVLRDGDKKLYDGHSVYKACDIVHKTIAPKLKGMDVMDQEAIDKTMIELDGTPNKSKLGGNTICSVSLAAIRAAAATENIPLYQHLNPAPVKSIPLPTVNCISGGSYQKGSMPFQEITVVPYKAESIKEAVHIMYQLFAITPAVIKDYMHGEAPKPGSLSGWQSPSQDPTVAFDLMYEAARRLGVEEKVAFATDVAASEFYDKKKDKYEFIGEMVDADDVVAYLKELTTKYHFLYVEDPLEENDWDGWKKAAKTLNRTMLVGDDITVTNIEMLKKAAKMKVCEAFIFKPNQVGTMTESREAIEYAKSHGIVAIPSVRAGGCTDDPIFDFAVAYACPATKQGPPKNGERVYGSNFLTRVEDENPKAKPYDFTPHIKF